MSGETPHPHPTKQELDAVSRKSERTLRWLKAALRIVGPPLRLLFRIPPIGRALGRTTGGRMGAICRRVERGDHRRAVDLAFETLRSDEYRHGPVFGRIGPAPPAFWWTFLVAALHSLEQLDDAALWEEAFALARDRDEPPQGYEIAECYAAFARWKYRAGDHDAALDLAGIARRADETWAEAELLMGWLRLALGGGDPLPHLTAAVRRDPGTLFRITKDPLFRQRPDIIARLKEIARGGGGEGWGVSVQAPRPVPRLFPRLPRPSPEHQRHGHGEISRQVDGEGVGPDAECQAGAGVDGEPRGQRRESAGA